MRKEASLLVHQARDSFLRPGRASTPSPPPRQAPPVCSSENQVSALASRLPWVADTYSSDRQWKTWSQGGPEPPEERAEAAPWDKERGEARGSRRPPARVARLMTTRSRGPAVCAGDAGRLRAPAGGRRSHRGRVQGGRPAGRRSPEEVRARGYYLHVADDGLEEASERAALLLNHSLHFPGAGRRGRTRWALGCARGRARHRREPRPRAPAASSAERGVGVTVLRPKQSQRGEEANCSEGDSPTCTARRLASKMRGEN